MAVRPRMEYGDWNEYGRARSIERAPSAEEQATIDALTARQEALQEQLEALSDDDAQSETQYCALETEFDQIGAQLAEIEATLVTPHPDDIELAGAVVSLSHSGAIEIRRGLIRPEDRKERSTLVEPPNVRRNGECKPKEKPVHSEPLTKRLTAHRTVALQAMVANYPHKALVVLTHRLAIETFRELYYREPSIAQVALQSASLKASADDLETNPAWGELAARRTAWLERLPQGAEPQPLFAWLLLQTAEVVAELMAFCVACSIDTVQACETARPAVTALAATLRLDMVDYWQPTGASYLNHVSKARIVDVVSEAVSPEAAAPLAAMKKAQAVAAAEARLHGSRWLPEVLRG